MISGNFIFNVTNFCVIVSFLAKLLTVGIYFSTGVRVVVAGILFLISYILALGAVVIAKLVILGIYFLTSFILALRRVLVVKLVISGILFLIFLILAL